MAEEVLFRLRNFPIPLPGCTYDQLPGRGCGRRRMARTGLESWRVRRRHAGSLDWIRYLRCAACIPDSVVYANRLQLPAELQNHRVETTHVYGQLPEPVEPASDHRIQRGHHVAGSG